MTLQDVKQFFKDNAEKDDVKSYLAEFSKTSPEQEEKIISNYKTSQDFKSEIDRAVSKGINTFKEKSLPDLIDVKVKEKEVELENKYNPPKNPAEEAMRKKLEAVETELKDTRNKTIREAVKNFKQKLLAEMNLPIELADSIYVKSDDLTVKDIEDLEKLKSLITPAIEPIAKFSETVKNLKAEEMLKNSVSRPTNSDSPTSGQLTREQYNAMPKEERIKAEKEGKCDQILGRL